MCAWYLAGTKVYVAKVYFHFREFIFGRICWTFLLFSFIFENRVKNECVSLNIYLFILIKLLFQTNMRIFGDNIMEIFNINFKI
jgi:hypothetical protein